MARVRYPALPLDRKLVSQVELNADFGALADGINHGFSDHDFLAAQVQHRHLVHPLSVPLEKRFSSGPLLSHISNVGWASDTGPGNYYLVEDSILELVVPHASLNNRTEGAMPVAHVKAIVHQIDSGTTNLITAYTIGVSHDGGTTWTPKEKCSRPAGRTAGDAWAYFQGVQAHYLTGLEWDPPSQSVDRGVILLASLGGGGAKTTNSNGGVMVAVMADHFDLGDNGRMRGVIELNARWATEDMS